jgi:hypothetical protein
VQTCLKNLEVENQNLRDALQAIVDCYCYNVGTGDRDKALFNLGHYILEAKELLESLRKRRVRRA